MDIETLKAHLQTLSLVPEQFQIQATACEQIYKSQGELKKLFSDKRGEKAHQMQLKCSETVKELSKNMNTLMETLNNVWSQQERQLLQLEEQAQELSQRINIVKNIADFGFYGDSNKHKRLRKIVPSRQAPQLPPGPQFGVDLYETEAFGIQPLLSTNQLALYQQAKAGTNVAIEAYPPRASSEFAIYESSSVMSLDQEKKLGSVTNLRKRDSAQQSRSSGIAIPPPPPGHRITSIQARSSQNLSIPPPPSKKTDSVVSAPKQPAKQSRVSEDTSGASFSGPPPPPPQFAPMAGGPPPPPAMPSFAGSGAPPPPPPPGIGAPPPPLPPGMGAPPPPPGMPAAPSAGSPAKGLSLAEQLKAKAEAKAARQAQQPQQEEEEKKPVKASAPPAMSLQDQLKQKLMKRAAQDEPTLAQNRTGVPQPIQIVNSSIETPAVGTPPPPPPPSVISAVPSTATVGAPPPPPMPALSASAGAPPPPPMAGPPPPPPMMSAGGAPPPPPPPAISATGAAIPVPPPMMTPGAPAPPSPAQPSPKKAASPGLSLQDQLKEKLAKKAENPSPVVEPPARTPQKEAASPGMSLQDQLKQRLVQRQQQSPGEEKPRFQPPEPKTPVKQEINFQDQLRDRLKKRNEAQSSGTLEKKESPKQDKPEEEPVIQKPSTLRNKFEVKRSDSYQKFEQKKETPVESPAKSANEEQPEPVETPAQTQTPNQTSESPAGVEQEDLVVALADYEADDEEQMSLVGGETYYRTVEDYGNGWSFGCSLDGTVKGIFPQTFVEKVNQ